MYFIIGTNYEICKKKIVHSRERQVQKSRWSYIFLYICFKNQNKAIIRVCHTEYRKRLILDSRLLYKNYFKNICIIYEITTSTVHCICFVIFLHYVLIQKKSSMKKCRHTVNSITILTFFKESLKSRMLNSIPSAKH